MDAVPYAHSIIRRFIDKAVNGYWFMSPVQAESRPLPAEKQLIRNATVCHNLWSFWPKIESCPNDIASKSLAQMIATLRWLLITLPLPFQAFCCPNRTLNTQIIEMSPLPHLDNSDCCLAKRKTLCGQQIASQDTDINRRYRYKCRCRYKSMGTEILSKQDVMFVLPPLKLMILPALKIISCQSV